MKNCTCAKWKRNIEILNAPYMLHISVIGDYTGEDFEYCPWCGASINDISDISRKLWAAAQLIPGEGMLDGINRVDRVLKENDYVLDRILEKEEI